MPDLSDVRNLRRRYIVALSVIAILVTAVWLGMRYAVDQQRNYSKLISLAGQQTGLSGRIAHFSSQMIMARDDDEFELYKAQLGRAISQIQKTHETLLNGDLERALPRVMTAALNTIYFDDSVGLNNALARYLSQARIIYDTPQNELKRTSAAYIYVVQYGPFVLEAMFSAATDAYDVASRKALSAIDKTETAVWFSAILILILEALFIFRPVERTLRKSLARLKDGHTALTGHLNTAKTARRDAEESRDCLDQLNRHLEERVEMRTRELRRELDRHERTESRLRNSKREQEAANRSKSEFLANMSHELRTPLNAIIGFSSILQTDMFGPMANAKQLEYIIDIHQSGEHLLDLINDILDVSALEAGKLHLNEEPLDLSAVIERSWRLIETRARDKGVSLCQNVPASLPWLQADERRIKQILLNLLTNSIKFTPKGGTVTLDAQCTASGTLSLSVRDTGIGMDKHDVAKAMTQFGQVDNVFSRTEEGTGLGLPLTRGLVDLHHGLMKVESKKGFGTRVTVEFPKHRTIDAARRPIQALATL